MNITNTLYLTDRAEWRKWLIEHYRTEQEIWLVYYRKETGKARIPYEDAVKEALCFGWIDSTVRSIDQERFAQKFSQRNPKSPYSQANKERLKTLIDQGLVAEDVRQNLRDVDPEKFEFPADISQALQANPAAWENFQRYSASYRRIRVAFIDGARDRPQEFEKRLNYLVRMCEKDKQFGFGIDEFFT
jgi:uncharacterized protein YdeI (YjbR/CyaY-like superfamily)